MAHQRAPRPTTTPQRNESPHRVNLKNCLQPLRQFTTQPRPSPHHPAMKHWRHRQHPTRDGMATPRQGKQQSSLNRKQPWSNRPHELNKLGKVANTNAERHSGHKHIWGSCLPCTTNTFWSSRPHSWKQLKEQERHCTDRTDTTRHSGYGYWGNGC